MIRPRRLAPILATLALVLAACGGAGGGTTSSSNGSTSGAEQSQAPATEPSPAGGEVAASPSAPAAAPSVADPAPAGGGGGVADVCALVTSDELASILGTAVTTEVFVGPPDTCQVGSTDGAGLAAFVLTRMSGVSASFVYDSFAGSPTATEIGGIGEKAAYDPAAGAVVVLKNGAVLSVAVFDDGSGSTDEASRLEQMKQIGAAAAGRM